MDQRKLMDNANTITDMAKVEQDMDDLIQIPNTYSPCFHRRQIQCMK